MRMSKHEIRTTSEDYPIDFVIPWVDGSDDAWLKERSEYSPVNTGDARVQRFRDMGLLRYWFRGVEDYAPWVNKIYFITWGHVPSWLNITNEKLIVVNHRDYIPGKYLPTFSSHTIELNIHRIEGLSEHFVYFNDDVFLTKPTSREDFFVGGLPCDCLIESAITPRLGEFSSILCETVGVINKHFKKSDITSQKFRGYLNPIYGPLNIRSLSVSPYKYIMGFYNHHIQQSHLKSTFEQVWKEEFEELDRTCNNKFRDKNDVNQYLMRYWNLCCGQFVPNKPIGKSVHIEEDVGSLTRELKNNKVLCINDTEVVDDFVSKTAELKSLFDVMLPAASTFEIN